MAEVIDLKTRQLLERGEEIETMEREELSDYLSQLRFLVEELDAKEPKNMNSEAYESWGEQHEQLEDLIDEVLDLLDEQG